MRISVNVEPGCLQRDPPEFCEKSVYLASRLIIKGDLPNAVGSGKSIFGGCVCGMLYLM